MTNPLLAPVANRGHAPQSFIDELVSWGRTADEAIFAPNANTGDIYAKVRPTLGPWLSPIHRKSAMLEVLRVLAGFESSWTWTCGSDSTRQAADTDENMEAGAFQVSWDSRNWGLDLRAVLIAHGIHDGAAFQRGMKADHALACEYIARLLRHTTAANGPILRGEIMSWLSREAVTEFERLLS